MPTATIAGVRVQGVSAAVPIAVAGLAEVAQVFGQDDATKLAKITGVETRHISSVTCCTSDLCGAAAEALLLDLGWSRDSVDLLIVVTQTADYTLPATACVLHGRLALAKSCAAFDVNLGCSGYVYGLWLAASLIASGQAKRALLLVGDTITKLISPSDRSVVPLFGDAGTATAIEAEGASPPMSFSLGTDGTGSPHLIVSAGAFRHPRSPETGVRRQRDDGNTRSDEDLYMDGAEVFAFTMREVPGLLKGIVQHHGWDLPRVDAWVLHQANDFMIKHLAKKAGLPSDRVILALRGFGNTSSASIPLAMVARLRDRLTQGRECLVLAGFGVGLSWAAVALGLGPLVIPPLVTYE